MPDQLPWNCKPIRLNVDEVVLAYFLNAKVMCKQKQHSPQMKKRCSDKNGFTFLGEIYRVRLLTFQQNILKIAVQTSCKPNYPTLNQTFQKVP